MKKALLLSCAFCATFSAFAQIPNASFENWSNSNGYNTPDGWSNINAMTAPMSVYTAEKGTPGTVGSSYLKLTSKTVAGMGVMPGIVATGNINPTTMSVSGGFDYNMRPANLTGSWQYMSGNSTDQAVVAAYLTKWDMGNMKRDTVAIAMRSLTGMVMSWATFSVPFTYSKGVMPDTALIVMSSSGMTPANNSYLYVDNLAFAGNVAGTGVSSITSISGIQVYPNPATDELTVNFSTTSAQTCTLSVTDMVGRTITSQHVKATQGRNHTSVNVHGLASGSYLLRINNGLESAVSHITIK